MSIKGLYDVLIEFESDPVYGDINDGRVYQTLIYDNDERKDAVLELRLPDYTTITQRWDELAPLTDPARKVTQITVKYPARERRAARYLTPTWPKPCARPCSSTWT